MKKLHEQRQNLQDLEKLVNRMEAEIGLLRNITHRYYLMHGKQIQGGAVDVPDTISFGVVQQEWGVICRQMDHSKMNLKSNYQQIKAEIKKLSE